MLDIKLRIAILQLDARKKPRTKGCLAEGDDIRISSSGVSGLQGENQNYTLDLMAPR